MTFHALSEKGLPPLPSLAKGKQGAGHPKVSVIVANFNGAHLLPDCLASLVTQDYQPLQVIVADNGSVDESQQVAAAFPVHFLALGRNCGLSAANNRGAEAADGDLLLFFNNDMRFDAACVGALVTALMAEGEAVFAADALQYDWEGKRVIHGRGYLRRGNFVTGLLPGIVLRYENQCQAPADVPWGNTANLMVWADKFHALGGFDESLFIDWEDVDLCWRAALRGWRTIFVPDAHVFHRVAASYDGVSHEMRRHRLLSQERNKQRFLLKTMPPGLLAAFVLQQLLRVAGYSLRGRPRQSSIILQAFGQNLRQLPFLLQQRRAVLRSASVASAALLRRFVGTGASLPAPR